MKQAFFSVNKSGAVPEILMYGYIGIGDGFISASDFVRELKALEKDNTTINVRINSGGGSIFEGIAIYSAIKNSPATINTYIDGMAASMASVIALAGNKVFMSNMARMMTHRAGGAMEGNADNMRQQAALLDSLEDTMCAIYASKTGLEKDAAKEQFLSKGDNWMSADEALAAKLVDEIFTADKINIPTAATSEKDIWAAYSEKLNPKIEMKQFLFTAANLAALNLRADAEDTAVQTAFDNLVAKAAKTDTLQAKVKELEATAKAAQDAANDQRVIDMLDKALNADKKITAKLSATFAAQYKGKPDELKAVLDDMPPILSVSAEINNHTKGNEAVEKMSWEELDKKNLLANLKDTNLPVFKAKYKETFGEEYKG
ncbi:head maturation protease, ClpP-related [Arachidicoccus soli]|nr:head maturation protease, ClpP-related [Arachidicoccus soli]